MRLAAASAIAILRNMMFLLNRPTACSKIIIANGGTQYVELSDIDFQIIKFAKYRHHDTANWRRKMSFYFGLFLATFRAMKANTLVGSRSASALRQPALP